jgi:hypothetical protein
MTAGDAAGSATPAHRKPAKAPATTLDAYTTEELALVYLRQARTAVVTMAVIAVAGVIASIILGIVVAVGVSHLNNAVTGGGGSSNCLSQGGTNPNC